jgi:hypothetical protein
MTIPNGFKDYCPVCGERYTFTKLEGTTIFMGHICDAAGKLEVAVIVWWNATGAHYEYPPRREGSSAS